MLINTKGIVLRSVKYGETSLILSIFTELSGLRSYMVKGVRSEKMKSKRAGLLQPTSLLEFTAEHKQGRNLQHIREFQPAWIYRTIQEEVVKNAVAVYSVELLLRLLPQEETMEDLFGFAMDFFIGLDKAPLSEVANYPLFFTIKCGRYFGYDISGTYSATHPYLDAREGIFTAQPPVEGSLLLDSDVRVLAQMVKEQDMPVAGNFSLNAEARNRMLDWYLQFLQHHTQHLSHLRSLDILREILH